MVVIDLASRKVVGNVDWGKGVRPHDPVFGPKNGLLYVTTELNRSISIIDPKTLRIIGSVPTDQDQSHMLVISRDGHRGYTANVGPGTVSVLDLDARKTIAVIPVSGQVQRISMSVDGSKVFTSDQTKPQLAVIDTATNKVVKWVPLPGSWLRNRGHTGWQVADHCQPVDPQSVGAEPEHHEGGARDRCACQAAGDFGQSEQPGGLCFMRQEPEGRGHQPFRLDGKGSYRCGPRCGWHGLGEGRINRLT